MANRVLSVCLLILAISFPYTQCWEAPWFCHGYECPMYTLVNQYEGFEERFYNTSHWITTQVVSTSENDLQVGFWKLYYFNQGENKEKKQIPMTRPVLVTVKEGDARGEGPVFISIYQPDPDIPDPNDDTIQKIVMPGGAVYVRSFGGVASASDALQNVQNLHEQLRAAEKQFDDSRFEAAGYDAPWELINRHNEIWIYAA